MSCDENPHHRRSEALIDPGVNAIATLDARYSIPIAHSSTRHPQVGWLDDVVVNRNDPLQILVHNCSWVVHQRWNMGSSPTLRANGPHCQVSLTNRSRGNVDVGTLQLDRGYDYPAVRARLRAAGIDQFEIQLRGTKVPGARRIRVEDRARRFSRRYQAKRANRTRFVDAELSPGRLHGDPSDEGLRSSHPANRPSARHSPRSSWYAKRSPRPPP